MKTKKYFCILSIYFLLFSFSSTAEENLTYQMGQVIHIQERAEPISTVPANFEDKTAYPQERSRTGSQGSKAADAAIDNFFLMTTPPKIENYLFVTLVTDQEKLIVKYQPSLIAKHFPDFTEGKSVEIRFDPRRENVYFKQLNGKELRAKIVQIEKIN